MAHLGTKPGSLGSQIHFGTTGPASLIGNQKINGIPEITTKFYSVRLITL